MCLHIELWIHDLGLATRALGLGFADMLLSEEELSIQVGYLDVIVICHFDLAFLSTAKTHKGKCLEVLTSESSSSNHESVDFAKLLLNFSSVYLNLVVVSTVHWSSIWVTIWQGLEDIVVEPLLEWGVLSCVLDDLLRDKAT